MAWTTAVGWTGFAIGCLVNIPQIVVICRRRSGADVSALTYAMLVAMCTCYLVRAIAIREALFITSHSFGILTCGTVLALKHYYATMGGR